MPSIKCPGCDKVYKVTESLIGKKVSCKACGKQFAIGKPKTRKDAAASSRDLQKPHRDRPNKRASSTSTKSVDTRSRKKETSNQSTGAELTKASLSSPSSTHGEASSRLNSQYRSSKPAKDGKPKKKKKSRKKFKWGVQWEKVGSGLLMMLIGGGVSAALFFGASRINFYLVGLTVVGLLTFISGLVGEEGVW